jgi:hypothetical protein
MSAGTHEKLIDRFINRRMKNNQNRPPRIAGRAAKNEGTKGK